jgi:hypothetical protein
LTHFYFTPSCFSGCSILHRAAIFPLYPQGFFDLRRAPLEERKRELGRLLRNAGWALHFNEHTDEPCACRKPKSGRIGDAARQPGHAIRCVPSAERGEAPAHLRPTTGAFSQYCNNDHSPSGYDADDAPRPARRCGPRTRDGSFQSTSRLNSSTENAVIIRSRIAGNVAVGQGGPELAVTCANSSNA